MASETILEKLTDLSIICGMNQRYSQYRLTAADSISEWIDVAVVVATMLCMVLAVVAYFIPKEPVTIARVPFTEWRFRRNFDKLAMWCAIATAGVGLLLIVCPEGREVRRYSEMFQSWSDLRQDVDSVLNDAESEVPPAADHQAYLERRYRELLAKKNTLNSREPAPDKKFLDECLLAEERFRGVPDEPDLPTKAAAATPSISLTGN